MLVALAGPSSRPQMSVRRQSPSPARPLRPGRGPTAPSGPGAFCGASERGPCPVLSQESGRLSQNRPGPVEGQSLHKHAVGAGAAGARGSASSAVPALGQRWEVSAASGGSPSRGQG